MKKILVILSLLGVCLCSTNTAFADENAKNKTLTQIGKLSNSGQYEQALERMKSWVKGEHPECFSEAQKAAEFIFPELKESKDENIRKAIMACCSDHGHKYQYTGITAQDMLYWLEKQCEQNTLNPDKVIAWFVSNICDFEYYVKLFKQDFGL